MNKSLQNDETHRGVVLRRGLTAPKSIANYQNNMRRGGRDITLINHWMLKNKGTRA